MLMEKKNNKKLEENGIEEDNVTMYGEFVTSYFAWLPMGKQKEKAEELNKMTKK